MTSSKKYLTSYPSKYIRTPFSKIIYLLELNDYDGYIPLDILEDLIKISAHYKLQNDASKAFVKESNYSTFLLELFYRFITETSSVTPGGIAIDIFKILNENKIDFRLMEQLRGGSEVNCYSNTFNYKFDLSRISEETLDYLKVTDSQRTQIDELPVEIIDILNFTNDIGKALYSAKIMNKVIYDNMSEYSQITKTNLTKLPRPDFRYKLAMKDLTVKSYEEYVEDGNKLIVGMSTNIKLKSTINLIYKMIGALFLEHKSIGNKELVLYIDFGNEIKKLDIASSIEMLKGSFQLSIFNMSNSEFLSKITYKEPNSTILFIPVDDQPCALSSASLHNCRINMIVSSSSTMIQRYRYMCSKTSGKVVLV